MAIQSEDAYLSDLGKKIKGVGPAYKERWRRQATVGGGVKSSRDVGPSSNWAQLAFGNCAWDKFVPGIDGLKLVLSEPNDFLQGETRVDVAHAVFSYVGICAQRRYLRAWQPDVADKCDAMALQWVAQMVLDSVGMHAVNAATPGSAAFNTAVKGVRFAWAHQRTTFPSGSVSKWDYIWRRGNGIGHAGTGLAKMAETPAKNQQPYTTKLFCDHFLSDITLDCQRIRAAYASYGYTGVARFIRRGSRGPFHDIRFKSGGYASVQERDIGTDERRDIVIRPNVGPELIQFPSGKLPRLVARQGESLVDMANGILRSRDSIYGNFEWRFNPSDVTLWLVQDQGGVHLRIGEMTTEIGPENPEDIPEETDEEETPPPPRHSGPSKSAGLYDWTFGTPIPVKF